jgi:hypothetical protein
MVKIWSIKKNGKNLEHQKEWTKFGAPKRMIKIWSTKKNGQNLEHQKNGQNLKHEKEWWKFEESKTMVKIWSIKKLDSQSNPPISNQQKRLETARTKSPTLIQPSKWGRIFQFICTVLLNFKYIFLCLKYLNRCFFTHT